MPGVSFMVLNSICMWHVIAGHCVCVCVGGDDLTEWVRHKGGGGRGSAGIKIVNLDHLVHAVTWCSCEAMVLM